ncbi:MAG: 1,4-alpha-glucan branching enzyme [Lachnospiraceae bacterium]|nr:1,4-alpha-glucan branching enzyme [Lachnospiraceae bacterium]
MKKKLYKLMNWPVIEGITYHEEEHPFDVLGRKYVSGGTLFQSFFPGASEVILCLKDKEKKKIPMEMADEMGFFAQFVTGKVNSDYEYEVKTEDGESFVIKDAYSFDERFISDRNNASLKTGMNYKTYECLGAFPESHNRVSGVRFAVWAPFALSVSVTGSFNSFCSGMYPMQKNDDTDIFEIFIPGVKTGDTYYYEIKTRNGNTLCKADPYSTCINKDDDRVLSVVCADEYEFSDDSFISSRPYKKGQNLSILEVDLCAFDTGINGTAEKIVKHVNDFGYDLVKLLPFTESLSDEPSVDDTAFFYAVSSKIGTPDDIKMIVDTLHKNGTGVIFDLNCSRFSSAQGSIRSYDGSCLYEHLDPRKASHGGSFALNFNYGREQVRDYLISNALYFIDSFHFDGMNINDLSSMLYLDYKKNDNEWVPNLYGGNENLDGIEFVKHLNSIIKKKHPDVLLIAEEEAAFPGITRSLDDEGLGFDLKFNNGFSDDYLSYISFDPYFRSYHHNELTFSMVYQYSEDYICGFNHSYAKPGDIPLVERMSGEDNEKFANLKLTLAYVFMHPGKKILMMGQDFGDDYTMADSKTIDLSLLRKNTGRSYKNLVRDLNKLYSGNKALHELDEVPEGFEWINCIDSNDCTLSFLRKGKSEKDVLMVVCNFAGISRQFKVGTPFAGKYKEILNTDDKEYGGSHMINSRVRVVSEEEADSKPYSIEVKLAPLSLAVFKFTPFTELEKYRIEKRKEAIIADSKAKEYRQEADNAQLDYEEAKAAMEEALSRMKEAEIRVKKALDNEKKELSKAKKAMEEAK